MRSALRRAAFVAAGAVGWVQSFVSHLPTRSPGTTATTLLSEGDNGRGGNVGGIDDFENERMDIVRMLQRSYYGGADVSGGNRTAESDSPGAARAAASLDPSTGRITNLPLWRVGWVETPGRRNCLNVHEMQYTHMFNTILSRSTADAGAGRDEDARPPYFGHLYLPGGTSSLKSGETRYRLKTWREEIADEGRFDDYNASTAPRAPPGMSAPSVDRSAVVGCLMQVIDHRRMEDGRLTVLVQALERFVVDEVVDTRPYAVANVQVLLDREDLPWECPDGSRNEKNGVDYESLRGRAVAASFLYHDYEYDRPRLPAAGVRDGEYLNSEDVPWIEISRLLPFAGYSTDGTRLNDANEQSALARNATIRSDGENNAVLDGEPPLEWELRNAGVVWDPPTMPNVVSRGSRDALGCDALETLLWLALDDFSRATGFALPEEVTCLLPPEMDYLDIKAERRLSGDYPRLRRQRRLSYLAPALIENLELPMKGMRQAWLNTPSVAARLLGALERYEYLNNKMMGRFE